MANHKETGPDFREYQGFLDPEPEDVGDERDPIDFAFYEQFVAKNERKHNVRSVEIEECFANAPRIFFRAQGKVPGEDLYLALGRSDGGRYLLVIYLQKADGVIMPVSARDMDPGEKKRYERK